MAIAVRIRIYPYVPTYTAPGHTCIYTGSVPSLHGIIGNDWYDRASKSIVNSVYGDTVYHTVGSEGPEGQISPNRMLTTTITDELRLATNFHSKVIGIAEKDRAAVLPAGHSANAAYCLDAKSGKFVTSSYYMDTLPVWVNNFNDQKLPKKYLDENWKTVLDLTKYDESTEDDEAYERPLGKETKAVFPHQVSEMATKDYGIITATPWGNTLTFDFAKKAIAGEHLGAGVYTDFLAVSCSSTDIIGHTFGPNSIEMEDCYIRFDRDLGAFLTYLDQQVGVGNYVVFLSADHGASHADGFNKQHHILSGVYKADSLSRSCNDYLKSKYGKDSLVEKYWNQQFYLNNDKISSNSLDTKAIKADLMHFLLSIKGVAKVLDLQDMTTLALPVPYREAIINGYNQKRSGDMQVIFEPAILEGYTKGTTHGTPYAYDTHIPLLWFGMGIKAGRDYSPVYMTDISATLAAMLHIQMPSGCIGKPIEGLLKK